MHALTGLVVDALATYRATRLITEDSVPFGPVRDRVADRWPGSLLDDWLSCHWCAGLWVAAGVTTARKLAPRAWQPVAMALALGAAAGLLATWETGN